MPTYNKPVVQEQGFKPASFSTELPSAVRDIAQNNQQVQRAAEGVADTVFKIASKEKQIADDSVSKESISRAVKYKNDLFHRKDGVYSKKGKEAFGALDYFDAEFKKFSDEEINNLSNDVQRSQVRNALSQIATEANGDIHNFMTGQSKIVQENAMKFGIEAQREDASLNYMKPGKVAESISKQQGLIQAWADDNGISPEDDQFKIMMLDTESKTHSNVLGRMVDSDQTDLAEGYLKEHKGSIRSEDLERVEKLVEAGSLKTKSQRFVDQLMADQSSKSFHTKSLAKINDIEDVKLRDETARRFHNAVEEKARVAQQDSEALFQTSSRVLEESKSLDQIPRAQWNAMTAKQHEELERREAQLKAGKKPVTDWIKYNDLRVMATNPETQDKFLKTDITEYRSVLADTQFETLLDLKDSIRKGGSKADGLLAGIRSKDQVVHGVMREIGLDPTMKRSPEESKRFLELVDNQVIALQQETGKLATVQEVSDIANNLAAEQLVPDSILYFDVNKRRYKLKPKDIPKEERIKIEDSLRRQKMPVNDTTIMDSYFQINSKALNRGE